ncbi:MAG: hypothetical protein JWL88_143 [Parcubacteria group bacterium]|nr:hypothetical protein [Parcubacteria group bacterium]
MAKEENIYAAKLRELGFVEFDPEESDARSEEITFDLVRDEGQPAESPSYKRKLPLEEGVPWFMMIETGLGVDASLSMTFADDGTGQSWRKLGETIDLTPYGFVDPFSATSIQ